MISIILLIFLIAALVAIFPPKNQQTQQYIYICFALVLISTSGLRGEGVDRDYLNYIRLFENYNNNLIEPLFYIFSYIIHNFLFSEVLYLFLIFAFIGISTKLWAIRQLSELWFLSLLIYIGGFFILQDLTQIRVGVASGFLLLCIKPIYERNWKLFLLYSSIAFLSHYSAIIILPLWFININDPKKILLLIAIPICYIFYLTSINIFEVIPIPFFKEKMQMYQMLQMKGINDFDKINVFNLVQLFKISLYYLFLYKLDLIHEKNKYSILLIKIFAISLCVFPLFSSIPILGIRISELFGIVEIILIPFVIYIFKPVNLSRVIVMLVGLLWLYTALFYNKLIL